MPSEIGLNEIPSHVLPKISVFGVGGAGINSVNNMVLSQMDNVNFVAANTDCQSLINSLAEVKIQLGAKCTKGLGAGSNPEIGRQAAEEASEIIKRELTGIDMLFIAAGMGGGTGTGASPVIAKMAKDMGILTIAIVIKPFAWESSKRMNTANKGVEELERIVDTIIVIENQKLMEMNNLSMFENYAIADGILRQAVHCVVSILLKQGFINRDFADIKTVLSSAGRAVIGYGEDLDSKVATDLAIHNPVLENNSIHGAKNILVNITGNKNIKPADIEEIINNIKNEAKINEQDEPNIIFGIALDEELGNNIRVSVIASGVVKEQPAINQHHDIDNNIQMHKDNINDANDIQKIEIKKTEAPVFNRPLNEDDLENDESFNLCTEDIPNINENIIQFQNTFFPTAEEKKKNTKITNNDNDKGEKKPTKTNSMKDENQQGMGLFDNIPSKQHVNFLSKIFSSIGTVSSIKTINDDFFQSNDNNQQEDIYDTPAIKRKVS